MLKAMLKCGYQNDEERINKITHWIESVQGTNGEYDDFGQYVTYYTSYAVLAFLELPHRPQHSTDLSVEYLLAKSKNGKVDDFGGTIMAAQAFAAYIGPNSLSTVYDTIQISRSKELVIENGELKKQIQLLNKKINEYDKKYKNADIVLSKKEAWKLGIWIGIITLILGIILPM